ncbi:hypothetical protein ABK040_009862 [Willaertia magna]
MQPTTNQQEQQQVNSIFDGLSQRVQQLHLQLKHTQSTITQISEQKCITPRSSNQTQILQETIQKLQQEIKVLQSNSSEKEEAVKVSFLIDKKEEDLLKELAIQKEINFQQQCKIQNYENAIQLILERSHNKIQSINDKYEQEKSLLTNRLQKLEIENNQLLNQNIILKSKLMESINVMREVSRERNMELILLDTNEKSLKDENEMLRKLLKIEKDYQ